jgi:hypothetical protein
MPAATSGPKPASVLSIGHAPAVVPRNAPSPHRTHETRNVSAKNSATRTSGRELADRSEERVCSVIVAFTFYT